MNTRLFNAVRVLALALAAASAFTAAAAQDLPLRCEWDDPGGGQRLSMSFASDAMVVVPPGKTVTVRPENGGSAALLKNGAAANEGPSLTFLAPDGAGEYYLSLRLSRDGETRDTTLCVFVPHRAETRKNGNAAIVSADGEAVGNYRFPHSSGVVKIKGNPESYQPPAWWIRMTPENRQLEIAPRLTVAELVAPAEETGIQHTDLVPVNYPMWNAIEALRRALEDKGIAGGALKLISMFRAPAYNRGIGSGSFGRHIYGDAFDFYIDQTGEGKSDDLTGDGRANRLDGLWVVSIIEDLQADGKIPVGGVGVYAHAGGDHGVTLHVDLRGHRATWGYAYGVNGRKEEFAWASRRFAAEDAAWEEKNRARAAGEGRKYRAPVREALPRP